MAYTKYSLTPANNTAAPPDGAPEGMLPSAVNDTMRDMMAQIRDCGDGIRDGTYTMTAPKITGGTITGTTFTGNTFSNPVVTGVSTFAAGTASAPPITTSGDTNTGIFFPAADTIAFTEGGAEAMRIDSSGNVGIGTSSPSVGKLVVKGSGTGSTNGLAVVSSANDSFLTIYNNGSVHNIEATYSSTGSYQPIAFVTSGSERMRIDSSGNVLVGTTDSANTTGVGTKQIANATVPYFITVVNDSTGSNYYLLYNTNATNNGYRFYVQANGGIANFSGNNTNLSDERTKENIELSSSYLDKICAIPVKTFNYKDEPAGEQKTLGVIAQDVEAVAPEFVNNAGFGETKKGETPLKSVYTTDLMFALMKSIQELKTELDVVKAELNTLKNAPTDNN